MSIEGEPQFDPGKLQVIPFIKEYAALDCMHKSYVDQLKAQPSFIENHRRSILGQTLYCRFADNEPYDLTYQETVTDESLLDFINLAIDGYMIGALAENNEIDLDGDEFDTKYFTVRCRDFGMILSEFDSKIKNSMKPGLWEERFTHERIELYKKILRVEQEKLLESTTKSAENRLRDRLKGGNPYILSETPVVKVISEMLKKSDHLVGENEIVFQQPQIVHAPKRQKLIDRIARAMG